MHTEVCGSARRPSPFCVRHPSCNTIIPHPFHRPCLSHTPQAALPLARDLPLSQASAMARDRFPAKILRKNLSCRLGVVARDLLLLLCMSQHLSMLSACVLVLPLRPLCMFCAPVCANVRSPIVVWGYAWYARPSADAFLHVYAPFMPLAQGLWVSGAQMPAPLCPQPLVVRVPVPQPLVRGPPGAGCVRACRSVS